MERENKITKFLIKAKYVVLVIICLVFASLRVFFPDVIIDGNTVWLLVIAAVAMIVPDLKFLLPYIKRLRIGDTEIELIERVSKIDRDIEKAKEEVGASESWEIPDSAQDQVNNIVRAANDDPRAAFLLLVTKIEEEVRNRLQKADIPESRQLKSLPQLVEIGVEREIFPSQLLPIFRDFWPTRNKVVHGRSNELEKSTILFLISVGNDILNIVSSEKK